jgi:hypothetical protein
MAEAALWVGDPSAVAFLVVRIGRACPWPCQIGYWRPSIVASASAVESNGATGPELMSKSENIVELLCLCTRGLLPQGQGTEARSSLQRHFPVELRLKSGSSPATPITQLKCRRPDGGFADGTPQPAKGSPDPERG